MSASTMKQWKIASTERGMEGLELGQAPLPKVGDNDVLVKIHAVSLNLRDVLIPRGKYPFHISTPIIPGSDGAGEVVEIGPKVTQWKKGDTVITVFFQAHQYGALSPAASETALGGVLDGTLREYAVFNENGLVRAPRHLSYAEASTLSCAALTSWNALYGLRPLRAGQVVLVQGSGGVSMFALQFAKAAGATVIATTSSAEKAATLKKLGADLVINYREDSNWGDTARRFTVDEAGVDYIIEVGGAATMGQSLKAIKMEGIINVVGDLDRFHNGNQVTNTLMDAHTYLCTVRGVWIGSKQLLEAMVAAMEASEIHPVLEERQFDFEHVKEAYDYIWDQRHFGKVVVNITKA